MLTVKCDMIHKTRFLLLKVEVLLKMKNIKCIYGNIDHVRSKTLTVKDEYIRECIERANVLHVFRIVDIVKIIYHPHEKDACGMRKYPSVVIDKDIETMEIKNISMIW